MGTIESLYTFVLENKWIILFYLCVVLMIAIFRKKFEFQAKIIALCRTKFGLKAIDRIGGKHAELIKFLGYCGIGLGFVGMLFIVVVIGKGVWDLAFVPGAPPVISPVIPGVQFPGSQIKFPFWETLIGIFFVVVIHEFSHGIVARAHNVKVLNTGIVFFGPLIGAFVEPDEKQVSKKSDVVKYSIFAAGPFSNMILGVVLLLFAALILTPVTDYFAKPVGVSFDTLEPGFPAQAAGVETNVIYTFVNNVSVSSLADFETGLKNVKVNETITIGNANNKYYVTTTSRNTSPDHPVIGVNVRTRFTNENDWWMKALLWFNELNKWTIILSFGLGFANLLPIGPVDGGRMIKEAFEKIFGKKKGMRMWVKLTYFLAIIILILLAVPAILHYI